jgi:hypothetical protein
LLQWIRKNAGVCSNVAVRILTEVPAGMKVITKMSTTKMTRMIGTMKMKTKTATGLMPVTRKMKTMITMMITGTRTMKTITTAMAEGMGGKATQAMMNTGDPGITGAMKAITTGRQQTGIIISGPVIRMAEGLREGIHHLPVIMTAVATGEVLPPGQAPVQAAGIPETAVSAETVRAIS